MNENNLLKKLEALLNNPHLADNERGTVMQAMEVIKYIQQTINDWSDDGK